MSKKSVEVSGDTQEKTPQERVQAFGEEYSKLIEKYGCQVVPSLKPRDDNTFSIVAVISVVK